MKAEVAHCWNFSIEMYIYLHLYSHKVCRTQNTENNVIEKQNKEKQKETKTDGKNKMPIVHKKTMKQRKIQIIK